MNCMNRPIKFRAWNNAEKKMYPEVEDIRERYETYLMQYTGLKDKNGKEIYEGDILKSTANGTLELDRFQLIWLKSRGGFRLKHIFVSNQDDSATIGLSTVNDSFQVIGNVYKNKELLSGN